MSVSLIGRSGALAFIKAKRLRIPLFMERVSAGFPSPPILLFFVNVLKSINK
ncbi:Uncharacterised protein [Shewanella putrefaciens]|nr:Uncharacterised protein [Shewanella putrefaciens]